MTGEKKAVEICSDIAAKVFGEDLNKYLSGLNDIDNAIHFIELAEQNRIHIISSNGMNWRDLGDHEIVSLSKAIASAIRQNVFLH